MASVGRSARRTAAVLLVAATLAAGRARAQESFVERTCGPGWGFAASFAASFAATYGLQVAAREMIPSRAATSRQVLSVAMGSLLPPLATVPLVAWLSPGEGRWPLALPVSIALRAAVLAPVALLGGSLESGVLFATLVAAAVEAALEYHPPVLRPGRGAGLRLGFDWEATGGFSHSEVPGPRGPPVAATGYVVELVHLSRGAVFQHGIALSHSYVWGPSPVLAGGWRNLALEAHWRGEWHRSAAMATGPFVAVRAGGGFASECGGDFCIPLRLSAGAELGWRFPLCDAWRLEAVVHSRYRLGGRVPGEAMVAAMVGVI